MDAVDSANVRLNELHRQLHSSLVWRLVRPLLRFWMNPRQLGAGDTILDEIEDAQVSLNARLENLDQLIRPAEVSCEMSDSLVAGTVCTTIIITNWNGASHLQRLFESFLETHPETPSLEFVIVDHASTDGSLELIRGWMNRLPIKLLCCSRNQRYSVANNLARRYSSGAFLIFVNNDVVFDRELIPQLLDTLDGREIGLVGVPLYYPDDLGRRSNQLQHAGIRFYPDLLNGFMRPVNLNRLPSETETIMDVAAVTAALTACRVEDFDAVGGFDSAFDYGFEDVDLALRIRWNLGKRIVLRTDTYALHQEFGTQEKQASSTLSERRERNAEIFRQRHNSRLVREVLRSQIHGGEWHVDAMRVRLPPDGFHRFGSSEDPAVVYEKIAEGEDAKRAAFCGIWIVDDLDEFERFPPPDNRNAVVVGWLPEAGSNGWINTAALRRFDLCICASEGQVMELRQHTRATLIAREPRHMVLDPPVIGWLLEYVLEYIDRPSIALKVATPSEDVAQSWGDFHFAEALGRALRDRGFRVRTDLLPDWSVARLLSDDVSMVFRGLERFRPTSETVNFVWLISHPEKVTDTELERFDHVFVASRSYARVLQSRLPVPVTELLQCTDPDRFQFVENPEFPERVLFVGNSKGSLRPSVAAAIKAGIDVEVWGTYWEQYIDAELIRGDYVDNKDLGSLYGNSGVVLNDHWESMRRLGFFSNRLFDALATGAHVVSDPVSDASAFFGDAVTLIDEDLERNFTKPPIGREQRKRIAEWIATEHSFAARAEQLDAVIRQHLRAAESTADQ